MVSGIIHFVRVQIVLLELGRLFMDLDIRYIKYVKWYANRQNASTWMEPFTLMLVNKENKLNKVLQ